MVDLKIGQRINTKNTIPTPFATNIPKSHGPPPKKPFTSTSLKKLLKIIVRAQHKVQFLHQNTKVIDSDINKIKEELKKRAEANKMIRQMKSNEFFERKKSETTILKDPIFNKGSDYKPKPNLEKRKKLKTIKMQLEVLENRKKDLSLKGTDSVALSKIGEKIFFLKNKISQIENEHNNQKKTS